MRIDERLIIVILLLLVICLPIGYFLVNNNKKVIQEISENTNIGNSDVTQQENILVEEPQIEIFKGNARPIAFMIDNNVNAQPQASINSAYIVYEIIVEGGETRLMALFKGATLDLVGPIRSARHYFLDYAMENDAIYAHLGLSPQADSDFSKFNIDHINGQAYDTGKARTNSSLFWRVSYKKAPHNAYTNTDSVLKIAENKGFSTSSNQKSVLNYVANELDLNSENSIQASTVTIPYSTGHKVQYKYNEETKNYTRFSKNRKITDEVAGKTTEIKNVIITFAKNYTLDDGENKGRQDVVTVGELDGYYITNGKAIKIKCIKSARSNKTIYKDLNGNEIEVNDGNTWINICPIDAKVTIE